MTVTEIDETTGTLNLQYQQGSRWIQYEMRLGSAMETPPTPEELAANPELATHDVDVRVLDADGPFVIQSSGDAFLDSSGRVPAVEGLDERDRLNSFAMLRDAVADFRALDLPPSMEQLRRVAIQIGLATDPPKPEATPRDSSNRVNIVWGPSSVVKWDFIVRKKPYGCCGVGDHSAVELRGWSASSSIVFRAYTCNHGTCSSDSGVMGVHCVMPGFRTDDGTHSRYFYSEPSQSTSSVTGGCSTGYNAASVYGHNCNDDSELQGRAIWYDSPQSTSGGSCNSVGPHNWAPGCTY